MFIEFNLKKGRTVLVREDAIQAIQEVLEPYELAAAAKRPQEVIACGIIVAGIPNRIDIDETIDEVKKKIEDVESGVLISSGDERVPRGASSRKKKTRTKKEAR